MKKNMIITLAGIVITGVVIFYFVPFHGYVSSDKFSGFPIPKNAELTNETARARIYDWSKASEENGIPPGYKLVIKSQGWKEKEREGASTYYEKGDKKIDLISQTGELTLIKDKN